MTATDLLAHLASLSVTITRTGAETVDLDGPVEVLTDQLVEAVRTLKGDLLELLGPFVPVDIAPVAPGDDGRRVWIRAMGDLLGYPRLSFGEAQAIPEGRSAWTLFTSHPDNSRLVDRAVTVLLAVDTQGTSQP